MNETLTDYWTQVEEYAQDAILIAWDTCHKIYLAMDEQEAAWFREEYPAIYEGTPSQMMETLRKWWDVSCGLRFISAVTRNEQNPNEGFTTLIPQGASEVDDSWDDDEDEDE